jgi:hypothetical protein
VGSLLSKAELGAAEHALERANEAEMSAAGVIALDGAHANLDLGQLADPGRRRRLNQDWG